MLLAQDPDLVTSTAVAAARNPLPWKGGLAGRAWKRGLDAVLAGTLLVMILPLMAVIAVLVSLDGGPVFYGHSRVGLGGRPFRCLKFRTMIVEAEECFEEYLSYHPGVVEEWAQTRKLRFDPRVTGIGKILRATSLDELPQLLNVLRGEMSLVGPRPVTRQEIALYGESAPLYASVRPGITGLWQVSGRNDLDYAARVALDARYVLERGAAMDLAILLRTPAVVLRRRGAR